MVLDHKLRPKSQKTNKQTNKQTKQNKKALLQPHYIPILNDYPYTILSAEMAGNFCFRKNNWKEYEKSRCQFSVK